MTRLSATANNIAALHANGQRFAVKVKESRACSAGHTAMPAFDVWVRVGDSKRGRHIATIVYPESA